MVWAFIIVSYALGSLIGTWTWAWVWNLYANLINDGKLAIVFFIFI